MKRVIKNVVLFMSIAVLSMVFTSSKPSCTGVESGTFFPDPECCNKYYECWDNVAIRHECPEGLLWNNDLKFCDFPWSANDCYGTEECDEDADDDDDDGGVIGGITCDGGGSGICYTACIVWDLYMSDCHLECNATGDPYDYCSLILIQIGNICLQLLL
ncbi:MAG: chitin binding domain-containing protein [Dysgonamonadaceae bacterium]|jgi:hypothetical protein|nr:chitin binding domain-containing protein [Dysgonamonadaceae bacterium]